MSTVPHPSATAGKTTPPPSKVAPSKADPETVTISGYVVDETYGPDQVQAVDPSNPSQPHARIGTPGNFPYTRGIHRGMYRDRLWTMRQFAGFGSADDT